MAPLPSISKLYPAKRVFSRSLFDFLHESVDHLDGNVEDSTFGKVESDVTLRTLDSLVTIDPPQADSGAVILVRAGAVVDPPPDLAVDGITILRGQGPTRNSFSGCGFESRGIFARRFPAPTFSPASCRHPTPRLRR